MQMKVQQAHAARANPAATQNMPAHHATQNHDSMTILTSGANSPVITESNAVINIGNDGVYIDHHKIKTNPGATYDSGNVHIKTSGANSPIITGNETSKGARGASNKQSASKQQKAPAAPHF